MREKKKETKRQKTIERIPTSQNCLFHPHGVVGLGPSTKLRAPNYKKQERQFFRDPKNDKLGKGTPLGLVRLG